MHKLAIAAAVAAVFGALSISAAVADFGTRAHHHDIRARPLAGGYAGVPDGFVMNGSFDWRHRRYGWNPPWYAYGYSPNCWAWTPHAYHYACDPNSRY
jgi:hypothetical protein